MLLSIVLRNNGEACCPKRDSINKNPADIHSHTHPAIPPRAMWLWPGMAPSLSGTKPQNINHKEQEHNNLSPSSIPQASLLCHGRSPSIFRLESQSRPPSLKGK